ncbi:serine/threonine protein kinase [Haloferula chungangensis]|uniref:Serine/threonine protein kinase n=2 Tax=Haloferula chungangensis TaxID=1048331 RepID=A0ABW2LE98_9BACT
MNQSLGNGGPYGNDHRLIEAYREATSLDEGGLEALCPSYVELAETTIRYEDEKLLGKGGVKEVCRAFDNHARRWVAMARLREDLGPEFFDLFVNEAWLTSTLKHPNIISVYDVGIDSSGRPFFTMDLKGNTTLADLIGSKQSDRRALLRDFLKICDAVAYAHSRDIIHLDLKPENIQTDDYGEVLVCDWGLGKVISQDGFENESTPATEFLDNMTLVGEIKGSPGYMAPEQVESGRQKDHRTDIFSLGCILHVILTGDPPFMGDRRTILEATARGHVEDPCVKYPSVRMPASLGAVTMKALARRPEDRYQSVAELRDDVQRHLDGFSTNAEERSFLRDARLFVSRNRTPVLITSLALILLTVLSTLFIQKVDFLHRSVMAESQLAEQYASKAEAANELYVESLSKSRDRHLALSRSLISSVSNLKNRGIFDTPMKSVREALVLADHALALDPDSTAAKYQLFALNLIQLNFKEALKYPLSEGQGRYGYMLFAEAFPEFDYSKSKRPSLENLREFLVEARRLNPDESPVIERMISYDAALRFSKRSYHEVIEELLRYLNPDSESIDLKFSRNRIATLRVGKSIRMIADPGGSEECVLRYLGLRSLRLETDDEIDLHQLSGLTIHRLDLSGCASFILEGPLILPSIDSIMIDPQKHSADNLRRWIQSSVDFEISPRPDS